jgi:hypothetical protein
MTPFEEELRKALARCEPADDFTERVLRQTVNREAPASKRWLASNWFASHWFASNVFWRVVPVAALLVVLFSAAFGYREHVRRVHGEAAKEQLLMAIHIAGVQLHDAQMRVKRIEKSEAVKQ